MRRTSIWYIQKTVCLLLCLVMLVSTIAPAVYAVEAADLAKTEYIKDTTPTEEEQLTEGEEPAEGEEPTEGEETNEGAESTEDEVMTEGEEALEEEETEEEVMPQIDLLSLEPSAPTMPDGTYQWYVNDYASGQFTISTGAELHELANLVNGTALDEAGNAVTDDFLEKTITLGGAVDIGGEAWMPIGTQAQPFRGVFEGGGQTISALTIGSEGTPVEAGNQGLFGYLSGTVKNLTVTGSVYSSGDNVGGIVGNCTGQLLDCTFGAVGSVVSGGNNVGGVAGYYENSASMDAHTVKNHAVIKGGDYVGGIYGYMKTDESGACYNNSGAVTGTQHVGGIAGYTRADHLNHSAVNTGSVTGVTNVGGIVGFSYNTYGTNVAVSNSGSIQGATNVGGILGNADYNFYCEKGAIISNSGTVKGTKEATGGLVGLMAGDYLNGTSANKLGGTLENNGEVDGKTAVGGIVGKASKDLGSGSNIDGSTATLINKKAISGESNIGGVAGYVGATIVSKNLTMTNEGAIAATGDYAGGIAGYVKSNTTATNLMNNTGNIQAVNCAGGLVGYVAGTGTSKLTSPENSGTITATGDNAGGFLGRADGNVTLAGALTVGGTVSAVNNAGGVVGLNQGGITGSADAVLGGICAVAATTANAGVIAGQVASTKALTIQKVSLTNPDITVTAPTNVGGLIGLVGGTVTVSTCFVTVVGTTAEGALVGGAADESTLNITGCYTYLKQGDTVLPKQPLTGATGATEENCFYLVADDTTDPADGATKDADFRSGLLAYKLGSAGWGQKIGTDMRPYPLSSADHPGVYKLTVTQNNDLPSLSVKPAGTTYDNVAYVNSGAAAALTATGLDSADDLLFWPLDRVTKVAHGDYTIKMGAEDTEVRYSKAVKVEADTAWNTGDTPVIKTEGELLGLTNLVNTGTDFAGKTITLDADIALTASLWTPIGTAEHPFRGTFVAGEKAPGGHYAISDFQVESTKDNWALFGNLDGAEIRNLTVSGSMQAGKLVAGIAAVANNSRFTGCVNAVNLTGGDNVGGIAAKATNCKFESCTNLGAISGGDNVGGVAGSGDGSTFTDCQNEKTVKGGTGVGGVVGTATTTAAKLVNCHNAAGASVTATGANCGGVAGSVAFSFSAKNCANAGTVSGADSTGGVIGLTVNATADQTVEIDACNNNAIGKVTGAAGTGGVIGKAGKYLTLKNCSNLGTVKGGNYTGGVLGQSDSDCTMTDCVNELTVEGSGSATGGVVGALGKNGWISACYNGVAGIVIGTGANTGGVAGTTSDLRAAISGIYNAGKVTGSGAQTGGVVGSLGVPGYSVTGLYNTGTVDGTGTYTGGVFGKVAAGCNDSITRCYNEGVISSSGKYVGGVTGLLDGSYHYMSGAKDSRMHDCWNLGAVTGTGASTIAGGITGMNAQNYAYVRGCFNVGAITTQGENGAAGISGDGFSMNEKCYYLDSSIKRADSVTPETGAADALLTARDSLYVTAKSEKAFSLGEVAYLLDRGDTGSRTELWGQGEYYPMLSDVDHPAVYKMIFSVSGPADGFIAVPLPEDAPPDTPIPTINGLKLGEETLDTENKITIYGAKGHLFEATYTLKDGYQIEQILTSPAASKATLDKDAKTVCFTMPKRSDASVELVFAATPVDPSTKYTVTFNANGGKWTENETVKTEQVLVGQPVSAPTAPTQDGGLTSKIVFTGWYTDAACTTAYNFTAAVRGDLTLYAGWSITGKHAVTFDAGEGTFGSDSAQTVIVTDGERVAAPVNPTREDFAFRGWYTDEAGTLAYDFTAAVTAPMTLYAGWVEAGKCTVIFDANGGVNGDGNSVWTVTLDVGSSIGAPEDVTKSPFGSNTYTLSGWKAPSGIWSFSDPVTMSMTLTAQWKVNPLSVPNADGFYELADLAALETLRDEMDKNQKFAEGKTFILTGDIELPADWTAIGEYMTSTGIRKPGFSGTFDGQGHTITLHNQQKEPLFGATSGVIKNLNIKGDSCAYVPVGVAYSTYGGTFENCTVEAKLYDAYAGILYYAYKSSTITNCIVKTGSIIVNNNAAAGIVAITTSGGTHSITNCIVEDGVSITGTGSLDSFIGGVSGILADGAAEITKCYSGANLTATAANAYVGGIAGHGNSMGGTVITSCGATGVFTLREGGTVGGIIGAGYGGGGDGRRLIDNSWFYGSINGNEGTKIGSIIGETVDVVVLNGYSCIRNDVKPTVDNYGAIQCAGADFTSGKVAWLLDTDKGSEKGIWTQDLVHGHPTLGRPTYYPATVSAQNGTLSIDGKTAEIYLGAGNPVSVTATPDEYTLNEKYGPQYGYVLTSLTVNGEACEDKTFTMPVGSAAIAAVFELKQIGYINQPSSGDGDGHGTGNNNGGNGAGTGENGGGGQGGGDTESPGAGTTGGPSGQPTQNGTAHAVTSTVQTNEQSEPAEPVITQPLEAEPELTEEKEQAKTPETPEKPKEEDNLLEEEPEITGKSKRSVWPVVLLIVVLAGAAVSLLPSLLRKKKADADKTLVG